MCYITCKKPYGMNCFEREGREGEILNTTPTEKFVQKENFVK